MTDRRTGGVGVTVDLNRTGITLNRQSGFIGLTVDLKAIPNVTVAATQSQSVSVIANYQPGGGGGTSYPITRLIAQTVSVTLVRSWLRALTQPQTVSLSTVKTRAVTGTATQPQTLSLAMIRLRLQTVTAAQPQVLALAKAATLARRISQSQTVALRGNTSRLMAIAQATSLSLGRQVTLRRAVTQAQVATGFVGRGYQRTVTATQSMVARLVKQIRVMRALTGNRRVSMTVTIAPKLNRAVRATVITTPRLRRQITLTRAISQAQAVQLAGVPVQLRAVAAVQTRSLALGRFVWLTRSIAQATLAYMPSALSLVRTLVVPTVLSRQQAISLTRTLSQPQAVSLNVRNVTPLYQVLVTTSVSQQVALSSSGSGKSAHAFMVSPRKNGFVVGPRTGDFAVKPRGVRFTVEAR